MTFINISLKYQKSSLPKGKLLFIVAGLVAVSGLLFGVSALAVKLALGHGRTALGFHLANLFRIQLTVLRHNITSGTVFADAGGLCGAGSS